MKLLKWLSVADRFTKIYLDNQLAPLGINSSQHMYLLKVCNQPGILQDSSDCRQSPGNRRAFLHLQPFF